MSHFFEGHGGGIERVAGQLCRQFAQLGVEPAWAASNCDEGPDGAIEAVPLACANGIERLTGLPMPLPSPSAIGALARSLRRSDAVVVHDALYATSVLALLLAKVYRKPVVLIQHIAGIAFSSRVLRLVMSLANVVITRPMLWAADSRVFISDTVRHGLLGTPARHSYALLFNGVDSTIFHPKERQSSPQPEGLDIQSDQRRVLFVGRYVEKKGLSVIRALAQSRPDLLIFLVGSGPMQPRDWRLANVRDLGVRCPEALADLYRWADLLLLPSVGEGYPLVIQEALACGLPVVCGEPANRADPAVTDWLCGVRISLADPQGSAQRCADAIDSFAPSAAERTAMSQYASRHYDWETMARSVIALASDQNR